jgi:outer membrane protein OmpA-like peptidoglycan-associated protein
MEVLKKFTTVLLGLFACVNLSAQVYESTLYSIRLQYGVLNYNQNSYTTIADQYKIPLSAGMVFSITPGRNAAFDLGFKYYSSPLEDGTRLNVWAGQGLVKIMSRKISKVYKLHRFQPYLGIGAGYEYLFNSGGADSLPKNSFHQFYIPAEAGLDINITPNFTLSIFGEYRLAPFLRDRNTIDSYNELTDMVNTAGIVVAYNFGKSKQRFAAPPVYLPYKPINLLPDTVAADTLARKVDSLRLSPIAGMDIKRTSDTVMIIVKVVTEGNAVVEIKSGRDAIKRESAILKDTIAELSDSSVPDSISADKIAGKVAPADTLMHKRMGSDSIAPSLIPNTSGIKEIEGRSFGIAMPAEDGEKKDVAYSELDRYLDSLKAVSRIMLATGGESDDTIFIVPEIKTDSIARVMKADTSITRQDVLPVPIESKEVDRRSFGIALPESSKGLKGTTTTDLQQYMDSLRAASKLAQTRQTVVRDTIVMVTPLPEVKSDPEALKVRTDTVLNQDILALQSTPSVIGQRQLTVSQPASTQDKALLQERDSLILLLNEYRAKAAQPPASTNAVQPSYTPQSGLAQQQMQDVRVNELEMYVRQLERKVTELNYQLNDVKQRGTTPVQPYSPNVVMPVTVAPTVTRDFQVDTIYVKETMNVQPEKPVSKPELSPDVEAIVLARVDSAMQKIYARLDSLTTDRAKKDTVIQVQPTPVVEEKATVTRTPLTIYFAINSSTVSATDLDRIRKSMLVLPWSADELIVLSGYTDPSGSAAYNLALSRKRVAAVKSVLLKAGVSPGQISEQIFGDTKSGNAPPEDERRVVIEFLSR